MAGILCSCLLLNAQQYDVLDKVKEYQRGMGAIVCLYDRKLFLRENLVALPIDYI